MDKTTQNYKKIEKKTNRSNVITPIVCEIFEYVFLLFQFVVEHRYCVGCSTRNNL